MAVGIEDKQREMGRGCRAGVGGGLDLQFAKNLQLIWNPMRIEHGVSGNRNRRERLCWSQNNCASWQGEKRDKKFTDAEFSAFTD